MFEYIQEELGSNLASGRLKVVERSDAFFELLDQRYPTGLNRIAWEAVKQKRRVEVFPEPRQITSDELQAVLSEYRAVVRQWLDEEGIDAQCDVVWLGDSTDVALEMSRETLLDLFPVLFSFPQHSYALPKDAAWCLNYVMEGELFFANAPKK